MVRNKEAHNMSGVQLMDTWGSRGLKANPHKSMAMCGAHIMEKPGIVFLIRSIWSFIKVFTGSQGVFRVHYVFSMRKEISVCQNRVCGMGMEKSLSVD
jgi:hypothetical protein